MPPISETERDLQRLEAALKQLEAEYNMFFAGRLPRPPWETRGRVEALVKRYDRSYIANCDTDRMNAGLCETIVEFAHKFEMTAVAKGIETAIFQPWGAVLSAQ